MRDRSLEMEFGTGGHGAPPYRDGYAPALAGTILKRTLLLAFLLDRAQSGLHPSTPLLFRVDAASKSSSEAGPHTTPHFSAHNLSRFVRVLSLKPPNTSHTQKVLTLSRKVD